MGLGRYKNGKFDLVVVANFPMSAADRTEWERSLKKASELLYNASDGQMQFGSIYVCDESIGASTAEFILHQSGATSYGTWGQFGTPGAALHLMPSVKLWPLTVLHEMGHHVWALGEEYTVAPFFDQIDKTNPSPNRRTIPIVNSGRANNSLVALSASAIVVFGALVERRTITANTATSVTVSSDFSDLPTNSTWASVQYQAPAECAAVANANYCIMERGNNAAGYFDGAGNWQNVAYPVTEFCSPVNHDPDSDTMQDDSYNKSCWEVIRQRSGFSTLTMPNPAAAGPATGWVTPNWIVLDKQPRFALVLDRSGSMSIGHRMADVKYGAVYWLEHCAIIGQDRLAVIWYDHAIDPILPLTQVSSMASLQPTINAINALAPRGATNIRDGLYEALDQIQTPATRAAVQVAVLLTDGKHNTPLGSSAAEVLPDFNEAGVRIYALGVGTPGQVDMNVLDQLATATRGKSYAVGDNQPGVVQTKMVEINMEVRGGIITTTPSLFPDSNAGALDEAIKRYGARRGETRLPLADVFQAMRMTLPRAVGVPGNARLIAMPVEIERGCLRASFSLVFPPANRLWLYLIDPSGQPVNMSGPGIHHRVSAAPHEFAVVDNPAAGRWHMVAVRPAPGPGFSFHAVAGGENPNLQVFGRVEPHGISGPVRLWASARWGHELSNLRVSALVSDPGGQSIRVGMQDETGDGDRSGGYEGYFNPTQPGRHHALIEIRGNGNSIIANPLRIMLHAQQQKVSLKVNAPRFVRRVPVYFDVGPREEVKDTEIAEGLVDRYQPQRRRPRKLESARKTGPKAGRAKRARRKRKRGPR